MQALYGAFSCISLALAYVADKLQPRHRAPAFGYVMASLCVGVLIGPLLGGALQPARPLSRSAHGTGQLTALVSYRAFPRKPVAASLLLWTTAPNSLTCSETHAEDGASTLSISRMSQQEVAAWVACGGVAFCLAYTLVLVPESLSRPAQFLVSATSLLCWFDKPLWHVTLYTTNRLRTQSIINPYRVLGRNLLLPCCSLLALRPALC